VHHFEYRDEEMFCEGVALARIAKEVGTPAYVYSLATLERHYEVFDRAFSGGAFSGKPHTICFSVKACPNLAILRALARKGSGFDVVSGGELRRALRAGADPKRIVFSGVGKKDDEIAFGIESGIRMLNVESAAELDAIDAVARRLGRRAPVALRVNPDVDAETHPYISTGLRKNKFGLPVAEARATYRKAIAMPGIEIVGIDCHIGSQLTKVAPFRDAIAKVAELARELRAEGCPLRYLDVGGGLGIPYQESEPPPSPDDYAQAIGEAVAPFAGLDLELVFEPGRVIVGNAGVLLTEVIFLKQGDLKSFVIVDAAMNDLIRPAFYDSYHAIKPVKRRAGGERFVADVVGPICETGDFLARARELERPVRGDLLAIMSAGAYGFAMSSNYNTRGRAAEVLVHGDNYAVIRKRETFDDQVRLEEVPAFLR
jgi:diaminopimelate decarboxylase